MGRGGIVLLPLGMHGVICSNRGDAIPFHPSSNGRLTATDARNAPLPFLSTLLAIQQTWPTAATNVPPQLYKVSKGKITV